MATEHYGTYISNLSLYDTMLKVQETVIHVAVALALNRGNSKSLMNCTDIDFFSLVLWLGSLNVVNCFVISCYRLVLCGLGTKHLHTQRTENFLLVLGFDQRTPSIIRAYHERLF